MMTEIEYFRARVESFIVATGMTPTRFGKEFAGDPRFVFQLREGREPRTAIRHRIMAALAAKEVSA